MAGERVEPATVEGLSRADAALAASEGKAPRTERGRKTLREILAFVRGHKEIYRIIDESEFVDPESFRLHYAVTADRIAARLKAAAGRGEIRPDVSEVHAWAIMGMNVFLGLRYGVWEDDA